MIVVGIMPPPTSSPKSQDDGANRHATKLILRSHTPRPEVIYDPLGLHFRATHSVQCTLRGRLEHKDLEEHACTGYLSR